jgi:hypothetical protein
LNPSPSLCGTAGSDRNPPGGWSPKSKSEWDKLPEHIRADIAKREKEVADGFAQYEGMRELRPYVEMARGQGQTLKQALDRYVGIENALRTPQALQAILHIAGNAGYSPQRLVQELAPQLGPHPASSRATTRIRALNRHSIRTCCNSISTR